MVDGKFEFIHAINKQEKFDEISIPQGVYKQAYVL